MKDEIWQLYKMIFVEQDSVEWPNIVAFRLNLWKSLQFIVGDIQLLELWQEEDLLW